MNRRKQRHGLSFRSLFVRTTECELHNCEFPSLRRTEVRRRSTTYCKYHRQACCFARSQIEIAVQLTAAWPESDSDSPVTATSMLDQRLFAVRNDSSFGSVITAILTRPEFIHPLFSLLRTWETLKALLIRFCARSESLRTMRHRGRRRRQGSLWPVYQRCWILWTSTRPGSLSTGFIIKHFPHRYPHLKS